MKLHLRLPLHEDPVPVEIDFSVPPTDEEIETDLQTLHHLDLQMNAYQGSHTNQRYRGMREAASGIYEGLVEHGVIEENECDGDEVYYENRGMVMPVWIVASSPVEVSLCGSIINRLFMRAIKPFRMHARSSVTG